MSETKILVLNLGSILGVEDYWLGLKCADFQRIPVTLW